MKVILTESQTENIKRNEFYKKQFFRYWERLGPGITKEFLGLFDLPSIGISVEAALHYLTEYLGLENSIKLTKELFNKVHNIKEGDCGGYQFSFKLNGIDEDKLGLYTIYVDVKVQLKDSGVTLFNGEYMSLSDAIDDNDIGGDVDEEVENCIFDYITDEIVLKTGVNVIINSVRFVDELR